MNYNKMKWTYSGWVCQSCGAVNSVSDVICKQCGGLFK